MAFSCLPLEVNANIAGHLDDLNIARFAHICPATRAAVKYERSPLWRIKFIEEYDRVPDTHTSTLKAVYQNRRKVLRRGARFKYGDTPREMAVLRVLRDLMVESFASGCIKRDEDGNVNSRNISAIQNFAKLDHVSGYTSSGILANVRQPQLVPEQTNLLVAVQIMLIDIRFQPGMSQLTLGFADAQKAMYAPREQQPIFRGRNKCEVDLSWVLNAIQFFKYHLDTQENVEMSDAYNDLDYGEKINAWRRPPKNGPQRLGKHWKGAYSFLDHHEVAQLRRCGSDSQQLIMDQFNFDEHVPFQSLRLDFSKTANNVKRWPKNI